MQDTTTTQLDPTALQNLLSGGTSAPSLIPESLVTTLTVGFIVLNVLGVLFFVFYVASMIRKWKVETAVLKMQKDIVEIKNALISNNSQPSVPHDDTPTPAQSSNVIAQTESANNGGSSSNLS